MMGAPRDPRKEAVWRKHVRRQRNSGLSIREFCHEHGLVESAFYFWRQEIRRRDQESATEQASTFVPLTVQTEMPATPLEVVLSSGHVVRVMAGFDAATLRQLLDVLEERSC
jgi:transposase-like protein